MKEIFKQFITIWQERNHLQKAAFFTILICVGLTLFFLLFRASTQYVPLFPGKILTSTEIAEIRARLNAYAIPFREDKEKGLCLLAENIDQVRSELSDLRYPKQETGKGFELFDTNTWIKGEKELQVLEMRALKGQLEKDLSAFEHIKSASVILDIPPPKSFNSAKYQTKASVILTLMPKARLSASELRAITNHLSGAVRGLESHMIAISDTTGKLYKAIDPEKSENVFTIDGALLQEQLAEKINDLLIHLVGEGHFFITVQGANCKTPDPRKSDENISEWVAPKERFYEAQEWLQAPIPHTTASLSIVVAIDKEAISGTLSSFQKEIERQIAACAKGYGFKVEPTVDFIPFEKNTMNIPKSKHYPRLGFYVTLVFVLGAFAALYTFLKRYKKKVKKREEETLFRSITHIDIKKLASTVQNEDPQTIALMLSYLEPKRAEQIIAALHADLQEEVLFHLSEIEKGEI